MVSAAAAAATAGEPGATTSSAAVLAAVASLETYSTALSAFTSAWRSILFDAARIDSTLSFRLHGFSQLELLCAAMDGPGLRVYLSEHRDVLRDRPARALDSALLVAPDPGLLVLAAAAGFCRAPPAESGKDGDANVSCRLLTDLLDRLRALGVKPSPEARQEARAVAAEWKRGNRIGTQALIKKETIAFLLLVGVFGLVEDVGGVHEVLDLLVSISGRQRAVEIFVGLGLDLDRYMPVLIQTMINKGKQLDAVKFIQALNLVQKYPILPVLRSYINDAAKAGSMIRIRGDDSAFQNEADAKESGLLGTLQKFIKEQKLEELPILEEANRRMAQLDRQRAERKRALAVSTAAAAAAAREATESIQKQQEQLGQAFKRPKLLENVVQGPLGQNIRFLETQSQQLMSKQSIQTEKGVPNQYQVASSKNTLLPCGHVSGVTNQYQMTSSQSMLPAITQSAQVVSGSQRPVGIQNQAPLAPSIHTQFGGLADYYGLASIRSSRLDSATPGPSTSNVASAYATPRSKLYSADSLAAASRASDKKGSSYSYSLSNMSTYNP